MTRQFELERQQSTAIVAAGIDVVAGALEQRVSPELDLDQEQLLGYCAATRDRVRAYQRDHEGTPPTPEELAIARLGDVIVMTNTLTQRGFLRTPKEASMVADATVESGYAAAAVVRAVKNPLKYLGVEVITPAELSGVLAVCGDISFSAEADRASKPSIGMVYSALQYLGVDLRLPVDDETSQLVADFLPPKKVTVSQVLASDPLGEGLRWGHEIGIPGIRRPDGADMSFEPGARVIGSDDAQDQAETLAEEREEMQDYVDNQASRLLDD